MTSLESVVNKGGQQDGSVIGSVEKRYFRYLLRHISHVYVCCIAATAGYGCPTTKVFMRGKETGVGCGPCQCLHTAAVRTGGRAPYRVVTGIMVINR